MNNYTIRNPVCQLINLVKMHKKLYRSREKSAHRLAKNITKALDISGKLWYNQYLVWDSYALALLSPPYRTQIF